MAEKQLDMGGPKPAQAYHVINYKYANPKGQLRNGQLLIASPTPEIAMIKAKEKLSDLDWYKIGTITPA